MKAVKRQFTRKELAVIDSHRTPLQVQRYLFGLDYNRDKPAALRSFRGVVRTGRAHCLEAAIASAVILEQHGYPPLVLDIESKDNLDHVVHLYRSRTTGRWGAVAKSRDPGLCGRKAVFKTVRSLVYSYFDPYIDRTGRIIAYGVGNLDDLGTYDWRLSEKNVWRVERYCVEIRHKKIRSSRRRYRHWRKRYEEFIRRFPDRKPVYFDNRSSWLPGYTSNR